MEFFADLHVHVGGADGGQPVKVTASRDLTVEAILAECLNRKGIDIVGIVDCASGRVLRDLAHLRDSGELDELPGGGLRYKGKVLLLLGSEVECPGRTTGSAHVLVYLPNLDAMRRWNSYLGSVVSNPNLSTQRARVAFHALVREADAMSAQVIIAHAFTPHRSAYGACVDRLTGLVDDLGQVAALELGLSADADMADRIAELSCLSFVSNSDAHSAAKIAREYNVIDLSSADFVSVFDALRRPGTRGRMAANYGLDPRLGKYHRTFCEACSTVVCAPPPVFGCPSCGRGRKDVVVGVLDRIAEIADSEGPVHPPGRPVYHHQVPLGFVPGLGPKAVASLILAFGSEMAAIHRATEDELSTAVGRPLALAILKARSGDFAISAGGGGVYGRLHSRPSS